MKHWQTTLAGSLSALGTYLVTVPDMHAIGVALSSIGTFLMGLAAADATNTPDGNVPVKRVGPVLMLFAVLGLTLGLTACSTPVKTAYTVEAGASTSVTAAMTAWGDYVALKHPPVSTEQAVKAAFLRYQAAELAAIDATSAFAALTDPSASADARARTQAAIAAAGASLADLVALLKTFGVTLP